jgi:hypothetical protein
MVGSAFFDLDKSKFMTIFYPVNRTVIVTPVGIYEFTARHLPDYKKGAARRCLCSHRRVFFWVGLPVLFPRRNSTPSLNFSVAAYLLSLREIGSYQFYQALLIAIKK